MASRAFMVPVAAFIGSTALVALCAVAAGYDPLDARTWARWDSFHYVNIALYGYSEGPNQCATGGPLACAHAGWFPGYPALFALPAQIGLGAIPSALITAWLFALATLLLLWRRLLEHGRREARYGLLFAALVPGMVYLHTVFPISVLTFFVLISLFLMAEERWVLAGLAGAAAAAAYPLGVLLAPIAAGCALTAGNARLGTRTRNAVISAGLVAAGFGAVMLFQRAQLGEWFSYFEVQRHPFRTPLGGVVNEVLRSRDGSLLDLAVGAQALFTTALAVAVAVLLARSRGRLSRLDWLVGIYALAVWAFPLSQTGVSVYRSNAALLPMALLLRHFSPALCLGIVAGSLALVVPMCVLFFDGKLV